jgi:hypothetical protein
MTRLSSAALLMANWQHINWKSIWVIFRVQFASAEQ